jgi:hypothetical protein
MNAEESSPSRILIFNFAGRGGVLILRDFKLAYCKERKKQNYQQIIG